jgi:hypothetical protein
MHSTYYMQNHNYKVRDKHSLYQYQVTGFLIHNKKHSKSIFSTTYQNIVALKMFDH